MAKLKAGGKIILSTDITPPPDTSLIGKIGCYIRTLRQRRRRVKMVDQAIQGIAEVNVGYTIHPLGHGRYLRAAEGIIYRERSFTVEILDVDAEFIDRVARLLRRAFRQESVTAVDYRDNSSWFVTE